MNIVQIGSYCRPDIHILRFLENKENKIYLIEPVRSSFESLSEKVRDYPNVTVDNLAITVSDGPVTLYKVVKNSADSAAASSISKSQVEGMGFLASEVSEEIVQGYTFETYIKRKNINGRIDYLLIDAEGHDVEIILSIDFSRFDIQTVIFEANHTDGINTLTRGSRLNMVLSHLRKFGYNHFGRFLHFEPNDIFATKVK